MYIMTIEHNSMYLSPIIERAFLCNSVYMYVTLYVKVDG